MFKHTINYNKNIGDRVWFIVQEYPENFKKVAWGDIVGREIRVHTKNLQEENGSYAHRLKEMSYYYELYSIDRKDKVKNGHYQICMTYNIYNSYEEVENELNKQDKNNG